MNDEIKKMEKIIEIERSSIPELYGISEFAKALGWTKQKVHTYTDRGVLPAPIIRVANRPLWTLTQVKKFALEKDIPFQEPNVADKN